MKKERLLYLLEQEKIGLCTDEEAMELENWYIASDERTSFTEQLSEPALDVLENRIFAKIEQKTLPKQAENSGWFTGALKVAAAVLVTLIAGAGAYLYYDQYSKHTERTLYGETRTVILPDGSEVTLNGNSEITYQADWDKGSGREIFLKGEAYIHVVHTRDHRNFRVRTGDDFSLDVLGTQFTVSNRKSGTRVVLNEGKVRCNLGISSSDTLILKPGEMVQFIQKTSQYSIREVEASLYSSWKDHKLIFKNTSLKEISAMLEETYGLKTIAENPELLTREISGSVPTDNMNILLEGVAEACAVTIRQDGNVLTITDRKR